MKILVLWTKLNQQRYSVKRVLTSKNPFLLKKGGFTVTLISVNHLEKTNSETISRCLNEYLCMPFFKLYYFIKINNLYLLYFYSFQDIHIFLPF